MVERKRRLELTNWNLRQDGSVLAEVTCRHCDEAFTVTFAPSAESGSVFSEHLALVAATFTLAFANHGLARAAAAERLEAAAAFVC
jgi:hypothetical protein